MRIVTGILFVLVFSITVVAQSGPEGSVQFNTSGMFGGDAKLTWDNTTKKLGIGTSTPTGYLHVLGNQNSRFQVNIQNTNTGTDATAALTVGSAFDSTGGNHYGILWHASPNFTPIGPMKPNTTIVEGVDTGGILIDGFFADVIFATANIERGRFTDDGRFAVGTDAPMGNTRMHVNHSRNGAARIALTNPNTGSDAFSEVAFGSAITGTTYGRLAFFSPTFAAIGLLKPNRTVMEGTGQNGMWFIASHLEGTFGVTTGGSGADKVRLQITANGFIAIGDTTNGFPGLKRNGQVLQVRLGDDSGYSDIDVAHVKVNGTPVVGSRCAAIPDADGSNNTAVLNSILTCMRAHGLIAQ